MAENVNFTPILILTPVIIFKGFITIFKLNVPIPFLTPNHYYHFIK